MFFKKNLKHTVPFSCQNAEIYKKEMLHSIKYFNY